MRASIPWVCLLLLLATGLPPAGGQAAAYGVTPATLVVEDAIAGQSYERTVTLQNQLDSPSTITVEVQGESGAWVTADPGSGFTVPARTNRDVRLVITVPATRGPGMAEGVVAFTTEPKSSGSGSAVRLSAAVRLNVSVGGEAVVDFAWGPVRAPNANTAKPPEGFAQVTNTGNVEATARVRAVVTKGDSPDAIAQADGELKLLPGASGEVPIPFANPLEVGAYWMRFAAQDGSGHTDQAQFQVTEPGAPVGSLLALVHEARPTEDLPVRIDGRFLNEGSVDIQSARLKAEVWQGNELRAALESDALAVAAGKTANLTVYWTPPEAGTYTIKGHVVYDGYLTPENVSPVNVQGASGLALGAGYWLWLLVAAFLLALLILVLLFVRRRRDRDGKGDRPSNAPRSRRDRRAKATPKTAPSRAPPATRVPSPAPTASSPPHAPRTRSPPPAQAPRGEPAAPSAPTQPSTPDSPADSPERQPRPKTERRRTPAKPAGKGNGRTQRPPVERDEE